MRYRVIIGAVLYLLATFEPVLAKDEKWFEFTSEHFLLFTDAGETKGRRLLADFEKRVTLFSQAFGKVPQRQFPIEIVLFGNNQDYLDALPRVQPPETLEKSAYLLRGPDRIFIVAKDKSPEDIANDAGHALGHALFERYVVWRPFWLAEGAAEYIRRIGRPADTKGISDDEAFAARDLITIVPSATYNDDESGGAFRTQSYRLLRILLDDKADLLKQYLRDLKSDGDALPQIQIDADAIDARMKAYTETPLKPASAVPAMKSVEAEAARLAIHRGDVLLAAGRAADASRYYNADSKEARAARAIVVRFSRSQPEAVRALDRASRELPESGLVQFHFGTLDVQDKKDLQAQIAALERATQLLPSMGRAYGELARAYSLNGQTDKALPLIARALELEPEFADHFYEIRAGSRLALGQFDQAFRDINIAAALPHNEKGAGEQFTLKIAGVRKKIETLRRQNDDRRLEQIRKEVEEEVVRREPPPKPPPPATPVPAGSISYEIEARAPIEVVETIYPEYPETLRKSGAAGSVTLRVDVGPDGKVKAASVAASQVPDLNQATVEAVKKWSFKPGNRSIRVIFNYSLQ